MCELPSGDLNVQASEHCGLDSGFTIPPTFPPTASFSVQPEITNNAQILNINKNIIDFFILSSSFI